MLLTVLELTSQYHRGWECQRQRQAGVDSQADLSSMVDGVQVDAICATQRGQKKMHT